MMEEEEDTLFDQEGLLGRKSLSTEGVSEKKKKMMKTAALTMSFFSMGLCVAIAGTTLPELGRRVDKDTEHMTFILVARSVGYLLGAGIGGILSDFFDQQLILFYVLLLTSVATVAVPWCTTLILLAAMIGVQGTAIGVLDTGGNLFCIRIWGKKSAPYMQFLHFAFGVGAFLAPLIARPFLSDSITEYSSNLTYQLPYSSFNHSAGQRPVRDLSHIVKLFDDTHEYQGRWVRNAEDINNTEAIQNISSSLNTTFTSTPTPTVRPKKPETVISKHLRNDMADSAIFNKKHQKDKPITELDDTKKTESSNPVTTPDPEISSNCTNCNTTTLPDHLSHGNQTSETQEIVSITSTSSTTSTTTTTTTSTTTTSETTTTTASTTTTAASSRKDNLNEDGHHTSKPEEDKDKIPTPHESQTTSNSNTTQGPRVENDLVNAMIETLRNMSKIQFAYLIVGLFLFFNAMYFISLFFKDGIKCSQRPEPSQEDLIRPPDPKSFVVAILTLLFFFFFFYVGMEQTFGILLTTFSVEYTQTIWTPAQAATIIALFWGCVALGRGISILIAHFFKAPCMMVLNLSITFTASILLSFAMKATWFMLWLGTALLGIGISSIFATTISWADSYYPLSGKATAVFVAGSGFGQMTIPVMTGYLYQNVNRMCLMYVVFGATCTLCVFYVALQCVASWKGSVSFRRSHSGFMMLGTAEEAGDSLDMDLIQAGRMGETIADDRVRHRKHNGIEADDTETTHLVELSD